jgi:hypothetical protein
MEYLYDMNVVSKKMIPATYSDNCGWRSDII